MEQNAPLSAGFQFAFLGLLLLYFLKDSFNGRSLAKRITKRQIVDNRTGEAATPIRCFVRNLPVMIWPVEVLVTFFSPRGVTQYRYSAFLQPQFLLEAEGSGKESIGSSSNFI